MDIALLVRYQPISIENRRFLLLFIQDITRQQQRAALERTFFHDINNMLGTLVGASGLLAERSSSELARTIHSASLRLVREVAIQRCLSASESGSYQPMWHDVGPDQILDELEIFFSSHPVARGRQLEFLKDCAPTQFRTDISLLLRVLSNMIINALEATEENGRVKVWLGRDAETLAFHVWNAKSIPEEIAARIFQRNFTTKEQAGRGVGTYSMKLFGEEILGGRVSFASSEGEGTIFSMSCPLA